MRKPLVSVIIPVYNKALHLERCIRSVVENTYEHLEIICINDGSTDNSLELLETLQHNDARIRIIDQPNSGVSVARNKGIEASRGEYVMLVDADDQIHRNIVEYLLRATEESGADIAISAFEHIFDENTWVIDRAYSYAGFTGPVTASEAYAKIGMFRDAIWGTLYRRDAIGDYRFVPELSYGEDAFFNMLLRSSKRNLTFSFVDLPLYYYFVCEGSLIQTTSYDKKLSALKHWIAHISDFDDPGFAVCYILEQAFYYKIEGARTANPTVPRRNRRKMIRACAPYWRSVLRVGKKKMLKCILYTFAPRVYLALLIRNDPTYRDYLHNVEWKYRGYVAKRWDEV